MSGKKNNLFFGWKTMTTLKSGKDKIQYICDSLRKETLEPAQKEAQEIIAEARKEAEAILKDAEVNAGKMLDAARECIAREKSVFESSMLQASKQSLEKLRQDIEGKLFNDELGSLLERETTDDKVVGTLITAIVNAVEKEGVQVDLSALVPANVSVQSINNLLSENILKRLRNQSVEVGSFQGGAQLKLHNKKLTIDISDQALKELLGMYLRKDFRESFFTT